MSRLRALLARIPPEAAAVGLGLFVLLAAFVAADPSAGQTESVAPFTDEAGNFVNARNFVQLGGWSTDEWNLHLVSLPFSLLEAASFALFGVGIVQARLPAIACVSLTAAALVWWLRAPLGRAPATFAGLAFASSGLILFYGRLAFLEDLVVLGLTLGALPLAARHLGWRAGIVSGACWAVAIGTKPSALFAVLGIVLAVMLVSGRRDAGIRRWGLAAAVTIIAAGCIWLAVIFLPNRAAVMTDMEIWPPYQWHLEPIGLLSSVGSYAVGRNDHLYGPMLGPLIVLATAGACATLALRSRLTEIQTRLAALAFGWTIAGFGILMLVSYQPNRYVVPLVPAMAILAALGVTLTLSWLRERSSRRSPASARRLTWAAAMLVLGAAATAPGLAWYGDWARQAEYRLVAIQDQWRDAVPPGDKAAGSADVALLLMRSRATTIIYGLANGGGLYDQGVRWVVVRDPAQLPPGIAQEIWAARETVICASWRETSACLYHLP